MVFREFNFDNKKLMKLIPNSTLTKSYKTLISQRTVTKPNLLTTYEFFLLDFIYIKQPLTDSNSQATSSVLL